MNKLALIIVLALLAGLILTSLSYTLSGPEFCRLEYLEQSQQYILVETGRIVEIINPNYFTGSDFAQCADIKGRNSLGKQVLEIVDTKDCSK